VSYYGTYDEKPVAIPYVPFINDIGIKGIKNYGVIFLLFSNYSSSFLGNISK
jgi:hypothetical protein